MNFCLDNWTTIPEWNYQREEGVRTKNANIYLTETYRFGDLNTLVSYVIINFEIRGCVEKTVRITRVWLLLFIIYNSLITRIFGLNSFDENLCWGKMEFLIHICSKNQVVFKIHHCEKLKVSLNMEFLEIHLEIYQKRYITALL